MSQRILLAIYSIAFLLGSFTASLSAANAGEVVFGPQTYPRASGTPKDYNDTFDVVNPKGPFWIQIENGANATNLVSSAKILINGIHVAGPDDFSEDIFDVQKDVVLQASNTLAVSVRGAPGSFISITIRRAEPNSTVLNPDGDLWGLNMGDLVALWWVLDDRAQVYILSRADTAQGPWQEPTHIDAIAARTGGAKVDITPDARRKDLCYQVQAMDANGQEVRKYQHVCIPKFIEPTRQGPKQRPRRGIAERGHPPRDFGFPRP